MVKALTFKIEDTDVKLPSHVDLVEGFKDGVNREIADYDQSTVNAKFDALSSVYLGINDTAVGAQNAVNARNAVYATYDAENGTQTAIHEKYYKKSDTVSRALSDGNGVNFDDHYAKKNGDYGTLKAGYATISGAAGKATLDHLNHNIAASYITSINNTQGTTTVTYVKGDGSTGSFITKDTTYQLATESAAGLMSAADKKAINGLATITSAAAQYADEAGKAKKLSDPFTLSISGGASGSAAIDGSNDVTLTLGNINASAIDNGTLAVARGGTGRTDGYAQGLAHGLYINGLWTNADNGNMQLYSVGCDTASDVAQKIVRIRNLHMAQGMLLAVSFNNINSADNPTLKIIDIPSTLSEEYPIYRRGVPASGAFTDVANQIVLLACYGNVWHIVEPSSTGGSGGSVEKLATPQNINGINFDGSAPCTFVALCDTAADNPTKTATLANFNAQDNCIIAVRFRYVNTAANPTLNINGTGDFDICRGQGNHVTLVNSYTYQAILLHLVQGTNGLYWRIIEDTSLRTIKLTGDLEGEATVGSSQTLTINGQIKPSAFSSITIDPTDYESDLNKITSPGFYRLVWLPSWKHRPSTASSATYYINILKSGQSAGVIQQMFRFNGSQSFIRAYANNTWNAWREYQTTAVDTIDTISGESEPETIPG